MVTVATTAQVSLVSTKNVFEPVDGATISGVHAALGFVETCTDGFYVVGGARFLLGLEARHDERSLKHTTNEGRWNF
jgi:hypothetical protein